MAANFTDEPTTYTEQQVEIESAVDKFLADLHTTRYEPTESNQTALLDFLSTHELDITHRNLLFAFDSLQDVLELVPFAPVVQQPAPSQPPTVPTAPTRQEPTIWRNGKMIQFREATRL